MAAGVQIVTALAGQITRLFDDAGASQIERYAALDVARALVIVSDASISLLPCEPPVSPIRPESGEEHG